MNSHPIKDIPFKRWIQGGRGRQVGTRWSETQKICV